MTKCGNCGEEVEMEVVKEKVWVDDDWGVDVYSVCPKCGDKVYRFTAAG